MIRLAHKTDLEQVAKVHSRCFKSSYSSQLCKYTSNMWGGNLLVKFFEEFLYDNPELFLVAEDKGKIIAYCMGYYMNNDQQIDNFIKHNRISVVWKTILLLLSFNVPTWKKMLSRFRLDHEKWEIVDYSNEKISNKLRGDLLSVCVLPEYRGKGYAQELMQQFLKAMKDKGQKLCLLSVLSDNKRAISYYKRNGFVLYRTRGKIGRTYMRLL